jgi:hypothetical protein
VKAPQLQPLRGEVVDQRSRRPAIRQHPPDLLLEDLGLRQRSPSCRREQLVVRDAAPYKKGEPGRQFQVGHRLHAVTPGRIGFDPQQEAGAHEHRAEAVLNT